MFDIIVAIVLCLVLLMLLGLLPLLVLIAVIGVTFRRPVHDLIATLRGTREDEWRNADAAERERMVRRYCAVRVIGRGIAAAALIAGAIIAASPAFSVVSVLTVWRLVNPIKQEVRDACSYCSSGSYDEPPYVW